MSDELLRQINSKIDEVESKLDKLDAKLDSYSEHTTKNGQDIEWIRGFIKTTVSLFIAAVGAVITSIISIFTGK